MLSGSLKWRVFDNAKTSATLNCPLELFVWLNFIWWATKFMRLEVGLWFFLLFLWMKLEDDS